MVEYNIVKYCRWCRKKYVVPKQEAKQHYCKDCQKKIDKEVKNERKS